LIFPNILASALHLHQISHEIFGQHGRKRKLFSTQKVVDQRHWIDWKSSRFGYKGTKILDRKISTRLFTKNIEYCLVLVTFLLEFITTSKSRIVFWKKYYFQLSKPSSITYLQFMVFD
jgi:hypothetical protein